MVNQFAWSREAARGFVEQATDGGAAELMLAVMRRLHLNAQAVAPVISSPLWAGVRKAVANEPWVIGLGTLVAAWPEKGAVSDGHTSNGSGGGGLASEPYIGGGFYFDPTPAVDAGDESLRDEDSPSDGQAEVPQWDRSSGAGRYAVGGAGAGDAKADATRSVQREMVRADVGQRPGVENGAPEQRPASWPRGSR